MERVRRLSDLWSWIPAFRVVAELEHLPSAAKELHVSASALSRSVRMLEGSLGVKLFIRERRRIILNDAGKEFLVVVRRAMRLLDDGIDSIRAQRYAGALRIAAPGPFAALYVIPALVELRAQHPELLPQLMPMSASRAASALRSGDLDLALLDDPIASEPLTIERLVDVRYGVYCGPGHPLYTARSPSVSKILEHPFATPPGGQDDHWPVDVPRKIGAHLGQMHLGLEICASGACLAVLPDAVAKAHHKRLRRLPFEGFSPAALYAVYREQLSPNNKTQIALDAVRAQIEATKKSPK